MGAQAVLLPTSLPPPGGPDLHHVLAFGESQEDTLRSLILSALVLAFGAGIASGQVAIADYLGFGWEDGGLPPSLPGEQLQIAAIVNSADPIFGLNLAVEEATIYVHGLISTGGFPDGFGNTIIAYVGGTLELWQDPAQNADWGVFPPNATSPATFMDGNLLLEGAFTDFVLVLSASGAGAYEGHLDGIAGSLISACSDCIYTWGGSFDTNVGAQVPDGYDVQIDGVLEVDESISTNHESFGALKALYRD